jgi:hypothetical protein
MLQAVLRTVLIGLTGSVAVPGKSTPVQAGKPGSNPAGSGVALGSDVSEWAPWSLTKSGMQQLRSRAFVVFQRVFVVDVLSLTHWLLAVDSRAPSYRVQQAAMTLYTALCYSAGPSKSLRHRLPAALGTAGRVSTFVDRAQPLTDCCAYNVPGVREEASWTRGKTLYAILEDSTVGFFLSCTSSLFNEFCSWQLVAVLPQESAEKGGAHFTLIIRDEVGKFAWQMDLDALARPPAPMSQSSHAAGDRPSGLHSL